MDPHKWQQHVCELLRNLQDAVTNYPSELWGDQAYWAEDHQGRVDYMLAAFEATLDAERRAA